MKNLKLALGVLLSLTIFVLPLSIQAREVNSDPTHPDAVSFHGGDPTCYSAGYVAGCEIAVDQTGNIVPTVTGAQTLGSSTLLYSNIYSAAANITANTVTGASVLGTAGATPRLGSGGTAATATTIKGIEVLTPYQEGTSDAVGFGVTASTIIPVNSSHIKVIADGAGSAVTLTSTPNISTTTVVGGSTLIADGTIIIITSTATVLDAVIFQSSGALAGSQLQLGLGTRSIWSAHNMGLIFDSASKCWKELWYH